MRIAVALLVLAAAPVAAAPCEVVPVWSDGKQIGQVCRGDARARGLTVIDLADDWVPPVIAGTEYAPTYVALAKEQFAGVMTETLAAGDRYLELYGIEPTLSVARARLADDVRHRCHDDVDNGPLADAPGLIDDVDADPAAREAAVRAVQGHLACDGLFLAPPIDGRFTFATAGALATFQRAVMLVPTGMVDDATRDALALPSRERDFRTVLRVLRERVVAATGLIEDGSARGEPGFVLGRELGPDWPVHGYPPLPSSAPDLISPATDAAARALGWLDPATTRRALAAGLPRSVAIALPEPPGYHGPVMQLAVEIDRGDVSRDAQPADGTRRPALVVYAVTRSRRIALVRWPTTIGGWQDEQVADDIEPQWKESPVGLRQWRDLYVGPTWLPPDTTPDRELVRITDKGDLLAHEVFGPSYRGAFGLVAFVHEGTDGIRTHATGNLLSLARGVSHGCHRLLGVHALRLAEFVIAHHDSIRRGEVPVHYHRVVRYDGQAFDANVDSLGYRIELVPPIPVNVLPGRVHRP